MSRREVRDRAMTRRAWPWRLAAREGLDTATTGRWTSLLVMVAVAWACAIPGAADAVGVTRSVEGERAWLDAGGRVFVVTGARDAQNQTNPVPAAACDALSRVEGIDASFALKFTSAVGSLAYIPEGRVSLYEVSPGALAFLGAEPAPGGSVLATVGFADRTGVVSGDQVRVTRRAGPNANPATSDPLTVTVVDSAVLGDEYEGSLLLPYSPSPSDATADLCYVRTDTAHYEAVASAVGAWLEYGGKAAIANPRLFSGDFTVDYTRAYEDRPLRWVWVPSAALLALVWGMIQWFRRGQVAIYATFGARPHSRLIMQATEWAVLAVAGAAWGWSLGVVAAIAFGARASQAVQLVTYHAGLALLAASAAVVLVGLRPTGTLLNALKDR
jgi:hypothetical protein